WDTILRGYPYGTTDDTPALTACRDLTSCQLPHIRADWFVAAASRPPLYHQILQLPVTAQELEKQLRVDVKANIEGERVARAGFNGSGVSRNNRLIERHESSYGAYWKSYDFTENTGSQNLFERPLGPGMDAVFFKHAGGEIIFSLPNGLQGYLLVDAHGNRIDKGPVAIVSDPKRPDRAVENGISCMSCHVRGINPKTDQIRAHVEKNRKSFTKNEVETVLALYPPRDKFDALVREDADRFQKAVAKTGAGSGATEPIVVLAARFEAELDLRLAAAETGLKPEEFLKKLEQSSPELGRVAGPLKLAGGTVQRQAFARIFPELIVEWKLGIPLALTTRQQKQPAPLIESGKPIRRLPPITYQAYVPKADKEQIPLTGPVADLAVGGGGRDLILRLAGKNNLVLFDVQQGKLTKEFPLSEDVVHFAAGSNRLVVVNPSAKRIELW